MCGIVRDCEEDRLFPLRNHPRIVSCSIVATSSVVNGPPLRINAVSRFLIHKVQRIRCSAQGKRSLIEKIAGR